MGDRLQSDQTADGHNLKLLHVVDEFTREALAIECRRRIDSDQTVSVLDRLVAERRSTPAFIRCDNGPEMTANALRDWCRFSSAGSAHIDPGSPWQNPYVESFGGRVSDELLSVELFSCLAEAQVLIEDWRQDYNHHRPHSALQMMTPVAFAASLYQPQPGPTATAAEEGIEQGRPRIDGDRDPQPSSFQPLQQQNPAEEITPAGLADLQPRHHYTHPALTTGGPMNGVRSGARSQGPPSIRRPCADNGLAKRLILDTGADRG